MSDSSFSDNSASAGGALLAYPYGWDYDIELSDSTFDGNSSTTGNGGAVYIGYAGQVTLTDLVMQGNSTDDSAYGGGLYLYYNEGADITHSWFCQNSAGSGGGVYDYYQYAGSSWTNNAFIENVASTYGGALYAYADYGLNMINNDLLGNDAAYGGALYASYSMQPTATPARPATRRWPTTTGMTTAAGTGSAASPLIDAGDPDILDPDGGRSDIGIYGGPDSRVYDGDGDGWFNTHDCDDEDATVYPGAVELCDGIDNDCDGATDEAGAEGELTWYADRDDDGYGDASSTTEACDEPSGYTDDATDCDDDDADINPGATDIEDDGIDQDCDGADATSGGTGDGGSTDGGSTDGGTTDGGTTDGGTSDGGTEEEQPELKSRCSCASASGSPKGGLALSFGVLALVGLRRRRS